MIVYQFMFLFSVDSAFMQGVKKVFGIGEEQKELVDPYFVFSFAGKEVATTSKEEGLNHRKKSSSMKGRAENWS